ncbi:MAG: hypothetical protein BGO27_07505 [Alphaproteobacteria bacterium 33-17]|nr:MAG: hypothetical protein BGO27_07505 [Alphaproteobacteria bacterium 33-17]
MLASIREYYTKLSENDHLFNPRLELETLLNADSYNINNVIVLYRLYSTNNVSIQNKLRFANLLIEHIEALEGDEELYECAETLGVLVAQLDDDNLIQKVFNKSSANFSLKCFELLTEYEFF